MRTIISNENAAQSSLAPPTTLLAVETVSISDGCLCASRDCGLMNQGNKLASFIRSGIARTEDSFETAQSRRENLLYVCTRYGVVGLQFTHCYKHQSYGC